MSSLQAKTAVTPRSRASSSMPAAMPPAKEKSPATMRTASAGTPQRASTWRRSLIGGKTSLFQSQPWASWARCSISTISLSSLKICSVNMVMNGHATSIRPGTLGRLTDR